MLVELFLSRLPRAGVCSGEGGDSKTDEENRDQKKESQHVQKHVAESLCSGHLFVEYYVTNVSAPCLLSCVFKELIMIQYSTVCIIDVQVPCNP